MSQPTTPSEFSEDPEAVAETTGIAAETAEAPAEATETPAETAGTSAEAAETPMPPAVSQGPAMPETPATPQDPDAHDPDAPETAAVPQGSDTPEAPGTPQDPGTPPEPVRPPIPSPDLLAAHTPSPAAPIPSPAIFAASAAPRAASAFGRVDEHGVVYVKVDGGEREVGSYPGASAAEALAYFGRKYDELTAAVVLLHQRVDQTDMPTKEAIDSLAKLREQIGQARVVGDLAALQSGLNDIDTAISRRREPEAATRAEAKAAATERRQALVTEAERIAAQPEQRIQWKASGARMRELLDEWKSAQRTGPRIDKDVETALWHRFSAARNGFDKARRTHFAKLDAAHGEARQAKEKLVAEAERLATSRDWATTAGTFKRLMDDWRRAGRASREDDDALWARFKTAQDTFFTAKDAVVQAQEETYRANLAVKEALLAEADAILPVTDLEKAKAALRVIQDKWDKAGRVPRADLDRTERALRRVEQAVRNAEDKRWSSSNPEAAARASSLVQQLEKAVAGLEADLAAAQAGGNVKKVAEAEAALAARRQWLEQAQSGLAEFGG